MRRQLPGLVWLFVSLLAGTAFAADAGTAAEKQAKGVFTLLFTGDNGGEVAPCG